MVPKNVTHLLQSLYLTKNGAIKKKRSCTFSTYFTNCISRELLKDPVENVTTIHVGLKLSALKPKHGKVVCQIYKYLEFEKGKNIILSCWKAAAITKTVTYVCAGVVKTLILHV